MSVYYENTANKLRPKTFKEIAGQEFVVTTICNSIEQNKIAHAYLFSGPRGVGKTSTARLVALAINRPPNSPLDDLSYIESEDIRTGKSLDVIEIDGASYTSVDNIRNIKEEIVYAPVHFKYKVYIIDEVHMLSNSAFNALLKTIEEPPEYVVFIFATTEVHKVPATIRSRCQQFSFRHIEPTKIINKLNDICIQEQIHAEPLALQWIAKEAQGSLRDAYTLFDQIKAFSKSNITMSCIKEHLGLAGFDVLNEIFLACLENARTDVLVMLDTLFAQGMSIEQFVIESAEFVRNLMLLKANINSQLVLGYPAELFEKRIYNELSDAQLARALSLLLECYRNLRYSINTRFEVELVFAQLCELSNYVTPQHLVAKLESIRNVAISTSPHTSQTTPQSKNSANTDQHIPPTSIARDASKTQSTEESTLELAPNSDANNMQSLDAPSALDLLGKMKDTFQADKNSPSTTQLSESPVAQVHANSNTDESAYLWNEMLSNIRSKNESTFLALDTARSTFNDEHKELQLVFSSKYGYDKYLTVETNIKLLANKLANTDVTIHASLDESSTHADASNVLHLGSPPLPEPEDTLTAPLENSTEETPSSTHANNNNQSVHAPNAHEKDEIKNKSTPRNNIPPTPNNAITPSEEATNIHDVFGGKVEVE